MAKKKLSLREQFNNMTDEELERYVRRNEELERKYLEVKMRERKMRCALRRIFGDWSMLQGLISEYDEEHDKRRNSDENNA